MPFRIRKPEILNRPVEALVITIAGVASGFYIWKSEVEDYFKKRYQKELKEIEESKL